MAINDISPYEMGQQLKMPVGENGILIAETMNLTNLSIYSLAYQLIKPKNNHNLLEIGFGNGKFLNEYFSINPNIRVYGIDFSEIMCNEAKALNANLLAQNKLFLSCQNAMNTNFSNNFFDLIITINTIYFWVDTDKQLNEISRILKKGGELLIGFRPKSYMENFPFTKDIFTLYELSDVERLLKQHGFEVVDIKEQTIKRQAIDGTEFTSMDSCIIAQKN